MKINKKKKLIIDMVEEPRLLKKQTNAQEPKSQFSFQLRKKLTLTFKSLRNSNRSHDLLPPLEKSNRKS